MAVGVQCEIVELLANKVHALDTMYQYAVLAIDEVELHTAAEYDPV